jgi:hypothetical protein
MNPIAIILITSLFVIALVAILNFSSYGNSNKNDGGGIKKNDKKNKAKKI